MKSVSIVLLVTMTLFCNLQLCFGQQKSAAMERLEQNDSDNELYTRFKYTPVEGLGYEKGIGRRDPSSIIKVNGVYYVWYTRVTNRKYPWYEADLWYATSKDGYKWDEKGPAVKRGEKGSWDERSVFTCNILVDKGKYYLVYQAEGDVSKNPDVKNVVGMAWANSPDGPWTKLEKPILETSNDAVTKTNPKFPNNSYKRIVVKEGSWDSRSVHDPGIIIKDGKYYLYYKGHGVADKMFADSKWGLAIADKPEGPYVKHKLNPITNSGHEVWVFPWKTGIAAVVDWAGPEKGTIQYSEDGVNFEVKASVEDIPPAGGAYIADKFADNKDGQGFEWGLCHYGRSDWNFLVRFDCDLKRDSQKDIRWNTFQHYSTIRDVMLDPEKFNVPPEALRARVVPKKKKKKKQPVH